jgi:homospermidine synthase
VPYQNATGLQVTSAILAAIVWAVENPNLGFVEADEMVHVRCLKVQHPYLGSVECHYTNWTPLKYRINKFEEEGRDEEDVWQFSNFLLDIIRCLRNVTLVGNTILLIKVVHKRI